jgi:hypothetical protein
VEAIDKKSGCSTTWICQFEVYDHNLTPNMKRIIGKKRNDSFPLLILLSSFYFQNHYWICGVHVEIHMDPTDFSMVILKSRRMKEGLEKDV